MLNVADVDELMFQLRHLGPMEAALRTRHVESVDGLVDHRIAERPVLERLRLRVRIGNEWQRALGIGGAADSIRMLHVPLIFPWTKCGLVALQVQVREEQRVIRDLPERVLLCAARPHFIRASGDGLVQHCK